MSCGTICASGTLGQIIPPSIVLIILGDVIGIPVGDLFRAAVIPGVVLVGLYTIYILVNIRLNPERAPAMPKKSSHRGKEIRVALLAILPPMALIMVVLGSIFAGIATPTESSALGGVGAILLAILYGQFSWRMVWDSSKDTVIVTAMVFAILLGATAFSMTFSYSGGDAIVEEWMLALPGEKWGFLILSMLFILVLGFFIDFAEISFIIVPIMGGIEATELFRQHYPEVKLLILSMHDNREYISQLMHLGARGYILKDVSVAEMVRAIHTVADGAAYICKAATNTLFQDAGPSRDVYPKLTHREENILVLIAKGLSNKAISNELNISVRTVESHRQNIKSKLSLNSSAELTKFAYDHKLI